VTAMLRIGSLLMIFFVTVPMVRDCCLPVTHLLPCHETKHDADVACLSNQQAITETKSAFEGSSAIDYLCPIADDSKSGVITQCRRASDRLTLVATDNDIYLRTCVLLI
jgi:hypothetical protein